MISGFSDFSPLICPCPLLLIASLRHTIDLRRTNYRRISICQTTSDRKCRQICHLSLSSSVCSSWTSWTYWTASRRKRTNCKAGTMAYCCFPTGRTGGTMAWRLCHGLCRLAMGHLARAFHWPNKAADCRSPAALDICCRSSSRVAGRSVSRRQRRPGNLDSSADLHRSSGSCRCSNSSDSSAHSSPLLGKSLWQEEEH